MVRLERALDRHADIIGLLLAELGQLHAQLLKVKLDDITKLGWQVALPRLTRTPFDRMMICLPSGNSTRSTCGLT